MGSLSKLSRKNSLFICLGTFASLYYIYRKQCAQARLTRSSPSSVALLHEKAETKSGKKSKSRVTIDAQFFKKLWNILKIVFPSVFSPETFYLLLIAGSLISRTYCDVWMIKNGTAIESAIIGRNMHLFRKNVLAYIVAIPAISSVNNLLKYGLNELKLRLRTRLTKNLYEQYLNGYTFYKMSNLDTRISNADHLLTQDVDKFCQSIVDLYSNVSKPILDIFLYVYTLASSIGFQAPFYMIGYLILSGAVLTKVRQPLAKMTMTEQELEGEFRFINSRLITNSEEIAFYQGSCREKETLLHSFQKLVDHLRKVVWFRFSMGFMDDTVAKYVATVVGFFVVSRPFLNQNNTSYDKRSHNELTQHYYKTGRMMLKLAEALGRLALAGRELTKLAGFTARVTELMQVLKDLNRGHYVRTMVSDNFSGTLSNGNAGGDTIVSVHPRKLIPGAGRIIVADKIIKFDHVPLITPNGDVLIEDLTFEVRSGMNVLVCGPNGCGKSSLFRILGELWPLFGGILTKPARGNLFYIPQRPYMAVGTLRDQVIYPDTKQDMQRKGVTDAKLEEYLETVQLTYVLNREHGWDAVQDWMDVLSGGEKQRIAMARLFYHSPQFAILDECTSAVSVDVEGSMYEYCRRASISLFTVSHRKSLWQHHDFYLRMDGRGHYEFAPINDDTLQFGS